MTWLSSEILLVGCFASGAYRSLKALKDGETNYEILVYWCALAFVHLYVSYFEWLFSWFPFYFYLKSGFLALLLMPKLRVSRILFHTLIIPGITYLHTRLDAEWPRVEALPYILVHGAIDLVLPGVLAPGDKAESEKGANTSAEGLGGPEEGILALRERARSNRTTRDLVLLNRRHHVSDHVSDRHHSLSLSPASRSPSLPTTATPNSPSSLGDLAAQQPPPHLNLDGLSTASASRSPEPHSSYFGNLARKVLTGSKEVSIRDHLFDLSMPPPPPTSSSAFSSSSSPDHHHHHTPGSPSSPPLSTPVRRSARSGPGSGSRSGPSAHADQQRRLRRRSLSPRAASSWSSTTAASSGSSSKQTGSSSTVTTRSRSSLPPADTSDSPTTSRSAAERKLLQRDLRRVHTRGEPRGQKGLTSGDGDDGNGKADGKAEGADNASPRRSLVLRTLEEDRSRLAGKEKENADNDAGSSSSSSLFARSRGRGSAEELRQQHLAGCRPREDRCNDSKEGKSKEDAKCEEKEGGEEGRGGVSGKGQRQVVDDILRRHDEEILSEASSSRAAPKSRVISSTSPSLRPIRRPNRASKGTEKDL